MVNRDEFVDESAFLQRFNYVYKTWACRDDTPPSKMEPPAWCVADRA